MIHSHFFSPTQSLPNSNSSFTNLSSPSHSSILYLLWMLMSFFTPLHFINLWPFLQHFSYTIIYYPFPFIHSILPKTALGSLFAITGYSINYILLHHQFPRNPFHAPLPHLPFHLIYLSFRTPTSLSTHHIIITLSVFPHFLSSLQPTSSTMEFCGTES